MISERLLRKWRKDALKDIIDPQIIATKDGVNYDFHIMDEVKELSNRILRLTQELLDQHLINKK